MTRPTTDPTPGERATGRFDLAGKVAVLTGAAGLLGRHLARGLADHGATLALCDVDADGVRGLAAELGRGATAHACDVGDPASVTVAVAAIVAAHGRIDVLLNNAATKTASLDAFFAPFEEYAPETWREVMRVNVDGMFLMARAVGPVMRRGGGGSIVQTASIYGVVAPDQRIYEGSSYGGRPINTPASYAASKAAVIGLTQYLATYWGADGIRVNTLTPGGVATGQNDEFQRRYSARVPLGRMAAPDDLVGAVVYLASDASRYVTGHNLVVDGGLSTW